MSWSSLRTVSTHALTRPARHVRTACPAQVRSRWTRCNRVHGAGWCESGLEGVVPYMSALCGFGGAPFDEDCWGVGVAIRVIWDIFYFCASKTGLGWAWSWGVRLLVVRLRMNGKLCY
jgi:hypothetical protein